MDVMSAIKRSIVAVKVVINYFAYAFIIAIARVNGDPKYQSYRHGKGTKQPVREFLKASGVNSSNSGGFDELQ